MSPIKYIGIFDSPYCLLIYLLNFTNQVDETYFFISDGINPSITKNLPKNFHVMSNQKLKKKSYLLRKLSELGAVLALNRILGKAIKPYKKEIVQAFGQDHIPGGNYFVSHYPFTLLEDGLANYTEVKDWTNLSLFYRILYKVFGIRQTFGLDDNVKDIYLTGLAEIPSCIKDKVHLINLKNLWCNKSLSEKEKILNIFNFNLEKIEEMKDYQYLLLTQPLSEDCLMTEEEKVNLYKEIVQEIDEDLLLIKVHPREVTDYKKHFPKSYVLSEPFPAELLRFNEIQFKKVITLFSTAANDYLDSESELVFVGTECHQDLVNQFGIIRYNKRMNKLEKIG